MPSILKPRVNETTTSTGTGNLTLAGAKTGFQTFNAAYGLSVSTYYIIEAVDGSNNPTGDWEYGVGHLSGSTTLVRDLVLGSSNSGSLVSLSAGTKNVFCPGQSLASVGQVGGRLTLTSATPVLTATVSGATTVYYTPYKGNQVSITLDGANFFFTTFSELSQATSDTTKSPAAVAASSVYDLFVWFDAGTLRCTRGPAWSSDTSRGTGAGTTELTLLNGIYVNKNAITNGPAANCGTYVGSIRSNGSSTIDFNLGGSASGGVQGFLYVWNYYNRVLTRAQSFDSGSLYSYGGGNRQARASIGNQINFLSGVAEDGIQAAMFFGSTVPATNQAYAGAWAALDTTSNSATAGGYGLMQANSNVGFSFNFVNNYHFAPQLGVHYISRNETTDGSHACNFDRDTNDYLQVMMPM